MILRGFLGLLTDELGGQKAFLLLKIRYTYFTMMELDTVIYFLKKIKNIYKARKTSHEIC